ncbi:unnamed protein product [Spodoptera exigua]|nr:unnamed protein product [Spodoptera exigua]
MKLFIVLAAVALAQAAKLDRTYLPPNAQASAGSAFLEAPRQSNGFQEQNGAFSNNQNGAFSSNGFANPDAQSDAYSSFEARPVERAQAAFERNAAILRQDNSNDGETYAYAYETENGISAEENGVATNGVQAQGGYSYTGDDGKVYSVRYTADENGFQPQGDHLPTSPPVPAEILKALEQNARDEAAGIYDDGSYTENKYAADSQQQYYDSNAQAINYNSAQSNNYNAQSNNYNSAQSSNYNAESNNYNNAQSNNYNSAQSSNYNSESNNYNNAQSNNYNNAQSNNYNNAQSNNYNAESNNYNAESNNYNNAQSNDYNAQRKNYNRAQSNNYNAQSNYNTAQSDYNAQAKFNAQSNYNNADTTSALIRNDASGSSNNANAVQKAYLLPFAQANTDAIVTNNALLRNDAVGSSSSSVSGFQRAYLPPVAQRQRNGARPSFNARDGYRY